MGGVCYKPECAVLRKVYEKPELARHSPEHDVDA
jgi:hypothetical protein